LLKHTFNDRNKQAGINQKKPDPIPSFVVSSMANMAAASENTKSKALYEQSTVTIGSGCFLGYSS